MSVWMQVLTASSWATLCFLLLRRFLQSEVAHLPVSELLRGNTKVSTFLEREYQRYLAEEEQNREMLSIFQRNAERLRVRMQASGYWRA